MATVKTCCRDALSRPNDPENFRDIAEAADLDRKYIKAHHAKLVLPPVQTPPLYFAGEMVKKNLSWGESPAQVGEKIAAARAAAVARGRKVSFGIPLHFILRKTDEAAWEAAAPLISQLSDDTIATA